MTKGYILTKSKYIRGLQCEKAMYLDVFKPKLAFYPPEVLAKFRKGRVFEKNFKDTFPNGVDISSQLRYRTFRNDVAIQYYVIAHALQSIQPSDLFCNGLTVNHFYLLYNDGNDGFIKEDLLLQADTACKDIEQKVNHFKQVLSEEEPVMEMSDHCDTPYECPYKRYCKRLKK